MEQTSGKAADIWALGVILYALIGSNVPFEGSNHEETFRMIAEQPLAFDDPSWAEVSPQCKDLVERLLTKDKAVRPTIQQVKGHPWFST